jgi:hypothetical protein
VWLLGSFAVLSLLYRADASADPAMASVEIGAEPSPNSADRLPTSTEAQQSGTEVLTSAPTLNGPTPLLEVDEATTS